MLEEHIIRIAKLCYDVNKAYSAVIGDLTFRRSWEDAFDWEREANIEGVRYVVENPDITPDELHDNWVKHKVENGWKFGEIKDGHTKTHPNIGPYLNIPRDVRAKDHIFLEIVKSRLEQCETEALFTPPVGRRGYPGPTGQMGYMSQEERDEILERLNQVEKGAQHYIQHYHPRLGPNSPDKFLYEKEIDAGR